MCIHIAASQGHTELVRYLLMLGADPNAREGLGGCTALHLAIARRCYDVVQLLLQEGRSQLDIVNYAGLTPYHVACEVDERLAEALVKLGASPTMLPRIISLDDSDEEDDDDEEDMENEEGEDSEEDSEAYRLALLRLGFASKAALTA